MEAMGHVLQNCVLQSSGRHVQSRNTRITVSTASHWIVLLSEAASAAIAQQPQPQPQPPDCHRSCKNKVYTYKLPTGRNQPQHGWSTFVVHTLHTIHSAQARSELTKTAVQQPGWLSLYWAINTGGMASDHLVLVFAVRHHPSCTNTERHRDSSSIVACHVGHEHAEWCSPGFH